jgi:hypothetical protein
VFREYKGLREIWVLKVFRVHKDYKDLREFLGLKDHKVFLETTLVFKDLLVHKVFKAFLVKLVL